MMNLDLDLKLYLLTICLNYDFIKKSPYLPAFAIKQALFILMSIILGCRGAALGYSPLQTEIVAKTVLD